VLAWCLMDPTAKVGEGTYGKVYRARVVGAPSGLVALKKIKNGEDEREDGLPATALREISILRDLKGVPNIVECVHACARTGACMMTRAFCI